jgi:hypothetical protein
VCCQTFFLPFFNWSVNLMLFCHSYKDRK